MRYYYEKPPFETEHYGTIYICNHPVYNRCTLFVIGNRGLAVIQQRFNSETKCSFWSEIDPWLADSLYLHPQFRKYFEDRSGECVNGLYPTVAVRQIMWALRMKPLPKQRWETVFDRKNI